MRSGTHRRDAFNDTLHRAEEAALGAFHKTEEALRGCVRPPEPRWPAIIASFAVAGLHYALPSQLAFPPNLPWVLPAVIVALMIPTIITLRVRRHALNQFFGYSILAVLTAAELWSVFLLVSSILLQWPMKLEPASLLRAAAALWVTNIIVFALWYWRIDAGGPNTRDQRMAHAEGAFLFPQMTLDADQREEHNLTFWSPNFVDYLFIAFTQSTSFAPADTGVLSRWAKILVMIQASISLVTIALLAARAVNIL